MPFTLAHPAVVLPLVRRPFVPGALVAGAMAPDLPYFLGAAGIASTRAGDWYGVFLNATETHGPLGLLLNLPFALALTAGWWLVRRPIAALVGFTPATDDRPRARFLGWLLISAVIGIATHLIWDALTFTRLLQNLSTAVGLAVIAVYLWRHRRPSQTGAHRLGGGLRWVVIGVLVAAPVLGAVVQLPADYRAVRTIEVVDYDHPQTVDDGNGNTSTSYPTTTADAPLSAVLEGVLTGAAKRAGAAFAVALGLYAVAWQLVSRRTGSSTDQPAPAPH
ncbi:DUF4184 family protein [Kribbella sandramycini]|nr:DUF4184 family protein [Kribbella sandramycini]